MPRNAEDEPLVQNHTEVTLVEPQIADLMRRYFEDEGRPILVAIGGVGGCGKSTFASRLAGQLKDAAVLRLDDYKTCRYQRQEKGIFGPHPDANEMALIREHLAMLKSDLSIDKPVYCSETGRATKTETFIPFWYNIIEGEVATYKEFADLIDFHIFIDSHLNTQLQTRMSRDVHIRGYSTDKALATFVGSNIMEFQKYGVGTKAWADLVLYCHADYSLSINEIADTLHEYFV